MEPIKKQSKVIVTDDNDHEPIVFTKTEAAIILALQTVAICPDYLSVTMVTVVIFVSVSNNPHVISPLTTIPTP